MNKRLIQERVEDCLSMSKETRARVMQGMTALLTDSKATPEEKLEVAHILLGLNHNDQQAAEIVQRYAHLDRAEKEGRAVRNHGS